MGLPVFEELFIIGLDKGSGRRHNACMIKLFFQKKTKKGGTAAEFEIQVLRSQLMQLKQKGLSIPVFTIKM